MSSTQSSLAKRVTNNYVVIPTWSDGDTYSGVYMITADGVAQWASDNALFLSVAGNTYTTTPANFYNLMIHTGNGIWTDKYYSLPDYGYLNPGVVLTDLGKDIYVGVSGEANILHLRLMQTPGTLANLGKGGWVGYVVVETNASDIFTDNTGNTLPCVSVARL
uniref:Uncharacterized protein n=1 Tax=viral metagenome TaxID=1070528 RepID=A0A6C0BDK4_9ZZZZ